MSDRTTTSTARGNIVWTRRDLPSAELSYRGHLRFLQGAPLSGLFLPLLLLSGSPGRVWRVPFALKDAVLAEVHEFPSGMSSEEVTLELMRVVLAPREDLDTTPVS